MNIEIVLMKIEIDFSTGEMKSEVVYRKVHEFPEWVKCITIDSNSEINFSGYVPDFKNGGFEFSPFIEDQHDFIIESMPFEYVVEPWKSFRKVNPSRNNFGITPFYIV